MKVYLFILNTIKRANGI